MAGAVGRVVEPSVEEILYHHEQRLSRDAERFLADPTQWIYVGSGAPAPDFQNGFFNVGGSRVPLRYRFLRTYDVDLDPDIGNPLAVQIQGSVAGGSTGLTIFTLKEPRYKPDGTAAWAAVTRDYDVHLTCTNDSSALVVVTVKTTGEVVYGFV